MSSLSKIAYIELIGKDKKHAFKHKVKLTFGVGGSDFFIPTTLPTGNYKLIAYTNWMKNVSETNFFQADIYIINPFKGLQNENLTKQADTISYLISNLKDTKVNEEYLKLNLNSNTFKPREKVEIELVPLKNDVFHGNYSISVKRIDSIFIPPKPNTNNYHLVYPRDTEAKVESTTTTVYLPELRGELLKGIVVDNDAKISVPLKNVTLAIPGNNAIFKSSITNNQGVFYFNLDKPYDAFNAELHVLDEKPEKYEIEILEKTSMNFNGLMFNDFIIAQNLEKLILEHSINNQVENAYSAVKQHEIIPTKQVKPFTWGQGMTYNLDDFTRFKTVRETVVEIIEELTIEKRKGKNRFKIRLDQANDESLSSLIIADGLMVINHDDLINYDSRKIQTISVVPSRYVYGGHVFEGIIYIETINGDFKNYISQMYNKSMALEKLQDKKRYFNQSYENLDLQKRIPDYRNQLYWEPYLNLNEEKNTIVFYTSDYIGNYEICIEGFTENGNSVSLKEVIRVE